MDIIVATGQIYNELKLAKNDIIINVPPINPSLEDRSKMRYYLEVSVPIVRNSTSYQIIATMDAAEEPLEQVGEAFVARGAFFNIRSLLASFLSNPAPLFAESNIKAVPSLITSFKLKKIRKNNGVLVDETEVSIDYAIYAGIRSDELDVWSGTLFTQYLAEKRGFLTWNPSARVLPNQPAFLSFLTNMQPTPSELYLRVYRWFNDGTEDSEAETLASIGDVEYMNIYQIPVGPAIAVGDFAIPELKSSEKRCTAYMVWLVNQDGEIVSDRKHYRIDWRFFRSRRFILFENSLGGWDSLAATGDFIDMLSVLQTEAERERPYSSISTFSEKTIEQVEGVRQIEVTTDWITEAERNWLEDLAISKQVILVTDRAHIPLIRQASNYTKADSRERAKQRKFTFTYGNTLENYSELPIQAFSETRATAWREYAEGGGGTCQLDSFGKRTGKKIITLLEQYYLDNDSAVEPPTIKANSPGTNGYIPPVADAACSATPFLNEEYTAIGTYSKNDCPSDKVGQAATITIAAGRWGSEISLADANSKALAEWNALNTQTYANNNGSCALPSTNGLRVKFWNYVSANPGFGPDFNFAGSPIFEEVATNANMNTLATSYPNAVSNGVLNDKLVVEWNGFLKAQATANDVQIIANVDDGIRVYVDDVLVLDSWKYDAGISKDKLSTVLSFTANQLYKLKVQFYSRDGFAGNTLSWRWTGQAKDTIPNSKLYYI